MSAILKFDFQKREQLRFSEVNYLNYAKTQNFACGNYIFPKTRGNKNKPWTHSTPLKGVLHLWALFLKTLCIFSKNKAISDKVSYGSGQKCSKELKNHSFTSVDTIVVKLQ